MLVSVLIATSYTDSKNNIVQTLYEVCTICFFGSAFTKCLRAICAPKYNLPLGEIIFGFGII